MLVPPWPNIIYNSGRTWFSRGLKHQVAFGKATVGGLQHRSSLFSPAMNNSIGTRKVEYYNNIQALTFSNAAQSKTMPWPGVSGATALPSRIAVGAAM